MEAETNIDLSPDPGWSEFPPAQGMGGPRSFVSGDPAGRRLRVRYYRRDEDRAWVGKVWFGPEAEGPPEHAHGGSMAAVLDEAMGGAVWMSGHLALAAEITVRFLSMLPLGTVAAVEAQVSSVAGRKVMARGRLLGPEGKLYCEAAGVYIQLNQNQLKQLKERYPETLRLFARIRDGQE